MSTNWAGASEGAIGVTLLRVREGVVFHLIIPGLHMERGWAMPGEMTTFQKTFLSSCVFIWCGGWYYALKLFKNIHA